MSRKTPATSRFFKRNNKPTPFSLFDSDYPPFFKSPERNNEISPYRKSGLGSRMPFEPRSPLDMLKYKYLGETPENKYIPKHGISFTQVFINKPGMGSGFSRTFNKPRNKQRPRNFYPRWKPRGMPKGLSVYSNRGPAAIPQFRLKLRNTAGPRKPLSPKFFNPVGEPNLACLPPSPTKPCRVPAKPSWHFSLKSRACLYVVRSSCDKSPNSFRTKQECEATCMSTSPRPTRLPKESPDSTAVTRPQTTAPTTTTTAKVSSKEVKVSTGGVKVAKPVKVDGAFTEHIVKTSDTLTHKLHIVHELKAGGATSRLGAEGGGDVEYVMVIGIVFLASVAVIVLVALTLMHMFRKLNAQAQKTQINPPPAKKESVIEAVIRSHLQGHNLPKLGCPMPLRNSPSSAI